MEKNNEKIDNDDKTPLPEERTVVTEHQIDCDGQNIEYTATAGMMHVRNEKEKPAAGIFYVRDVSSPRPRLVCARV